MTNSAHSEGLPFILRRFSFLLEHVDDHFLPLFCQVRSHESNQRARDFSLFEDGATSLIKVILAPHLKYLTAFEHAPHLVQKPRGLHHGQIRHVHVRLGHGGRVPRSGELAFDC